MSAAARIDDLKKRYDENPRRFFAPLANEYRKAGDLEQAISLCQAHLPEQPANMSGHVVLGQALFDAGRFDEAKTVFEAALALDPENLIALRHLGDIARAHGDRSAARRCYARVLETDPRNHEIIALLADLGPEPAPAVDRIAQGDSYPQAGRPEISRADIARPPMATPGFPVRVATPPVPIRRATPAFATPAVAQPAVEDGASPDQVGLLDLSINLDVVDADAFGAAQGDSPADLQAFGDVTIAEPDTSTPAVDVGEATPTADQDASDPVGASETDHSGMASEFGDIDLTATSFSLEDADSGVSASPLEDREFETSGFTDEGPAVSGFVEPDAFATGFADSSEHSAADLGREAFPEAGAEPESCAFDVNEAFADLDSAFGEPASATAGDRAAESLTVPDESALPPSGDIDQGAPAYPVAHEGAPEAGEDGTFVPTDVDALTSAATELEPPEVAPDEPAFAAHPPALDDASLVPASRKLDGVAEPETAAAVPDDAAPAGVPDDPDDSAVDAPRAFVTMTMAELYLQQGFREEALGVYRQLATQNPDDENLQQRTRELEAAIREAADRDAAEREAPRVAPARPAISHAVARGNRSARDFFGALAARRGRRRTASAGPDASETVTFSNVHPPIDAEPIGAGGTLDALFGNRDVTAADEDLARAFAGVADGVDGLDGDSVMNQVTGTGAGDLSLASVFGSGPSGGTGVVPRQADKLRFDQFFSGAPQVADRPPVPAGEDASSEPPAGEPGSHAELEQFRDWLQQFRQP